MSSLSIPSVSMSCVVTLKAVLELWTRYGFTGLIVTEALLCPITGNLCPVPEVVSSDTSFPRVGDFVAFPDPFYSCTAAVSSSEDELITEEEARDVLLDRPACDSASLQGLCVEEYLVVVLAIAVSPAHQIYSGMLTQVAYLLGLLVMSAVPSV